MNNFRNSNQLTQGYLGCATLMLLLCSSAQASIIGNEMPRDNETHVPQNVIIGPCINAQCSMKEKETGLIVDLRLVFSYISGQASYWTPVESLQPNTSYVSEVGPIMAEFETGDFVDNSAPTATGARASARWIGGNGQCAGSYWTDTRLCFDSLVDDHSQIEQLRYSVYNANGEFSGGWSIDADTLCGNVFFFDGADTIDYAVFDAAGNFGARQTVKVEKTEEGFCCASMQTQNSRMLWLAGFALFTLYRRGKRSK